MEFFLKGPPPGIDSSACDVCFQISDITQQGSTQLPLWPCSRFPPRLSGIYWLHMALLCNVTFEFQSLFRRLHSQPTAALHTPALGSNDMSFLAVAYLITQIFSSDARDCGCFCLSRFFCVYPNCWGR